MVKARVFKVRPGDRKPAPTIDRELLYQRLDAWLERVVDEGLRDGEHHEFAVGLRVDPKTGRARWWWSSATRLRESKRQRHQPVE